MISAAHILSSGAFDAWAAGKHLHWLFLGALAVTFLFYFFTWSVPPQSLRLRLLECILEGLLIVAWIASYWLLPFRSLSHSQKILWGTAALLLVGLMGYSIWQYRKQKNVSN